jgi:NAD(P)-dependent dehydrogenase (short-subunit alcohol dehydrogenase family)
VDLGLTGKVIMVTGGSDGLGRALCNELVAEGARVALCARDEGRLGATANVLREAGGDVLGVTADVTRPDQLRRFVDLTVERWGRIDGVVNNAGRSAAKRVADTDDADWDDDLGLKLYSAVRLTRLTLPHLQARGGAIVNTLATGAKAPGAASTPTSVSRAAGMALTKALSKELGPVGIRVNAVVIGFLESGQWERLAEQLGQPLHEFYERMGRESGIPLGRVGRAEDFADLVTYLLSPRSAYVTGTAINLDGGLCPVV